MAKVKGYLAGSKGKIGNLTFYHNGANGETQVRQIVEVKNPKTKLQRIQRVIAKTSVKCYQAMKEIADHAFEGKTMGAQCMNRFNELNMRYFRSRAAQIINEGGSLNEFYNFIPLGSNDFKPAAVYLSEGSINPVQCNIIKVSNNYRVAMPMGGYNTYQSVLDLYGLQRGDQLTFCFVVKNYLTGGYDFRYKRVILDPRNEDGSGAPMNASLIVDGAINKPNQRNQGLFDFLEYSADNGFVFGSRLGVICAAGIIVSRKGSNYWFRSNCKMVISEEAIGADLTSLDAASEEQTTTITIEDVDAYLNNAGVGGSEGTSEGGVIPPGPEDDTPIYNNTVAINGVSQNVSGGSVDIRGTLNSVVVTGFNMEEGSVTLAVYDSPETPATSQTSTRVEWADLGILGTTEGAVVVVYKEGMQWFTINVRAQQDGGDDD